MRKFTAYLKQECGAKGVNYPRPERIVDISPCRFFFETSHVGSGKWIYSRRGILLFLSALSFMALAKEPTLTPSQPTSAAVQSARSISFNQEVLELSLPEAIFLGLRDNRFIQSAYLQRIAQKFDLKVAEDKFTPKFMIAGSTLSGRSNVEAYRTQELAPEASVLSPLGTRFSLSWAGNRRKGDLSGDYQSNGVTFGLIQPLLKNAGIDANMASVRLSRLTEKYNQLNLRSSVSQTITQISSTYRDLLRAQDQVRIAKESLVRSQQLLEVNKALIAAGRMAAQEIVQTEANVATQEISIEEANNALESTQRQLLQLLALNLNRPIVASDALRAEWIEVSHANAISISLANQPAYLQQLIAQEQAAINLAYAKNQRLWDVSLVGGRTQRQEFLPQNSPAERQWDNYIGLRLEIPLGDLSAKQAETQARVNVLDLEVRVADAKQTLEREVGDAVRTLMTRWRQYELAQRAMALSAQKVRVERDKLRVGRSSNFQVLSFESDLKNAENTQLNALIAYLNAQTSLDEKLGMTLTSWEVSLND